MKRWNDEWWTTPYKVWFILAVCFGAVLGAMVSTLWIGELNDRASVVDPCGQCKIVPIDEGEGR